MKGIRNQLYDSAEDFFNLDGNSVMLLTPSAAMDVCARAAMSHCYVSRVEGGIWHAPGFEARLDCIWDGVDRPISPQLVSANNEKARLFISEESREHNAFVVSLLPAAT